jgi:hypothetical protein
VFVLPIVLTAALVVAWGLLARRALRRWERWSRAVQRADGLRRHRLSARDPALELEPGDAVLRGVLRAPSARTVRSREKGGKRGSPLARRRALTSGGGQAELWLELDAHAWSRVELVGPLRVIVGSRQELGREIRRTLFTGDRVIARGRLESAEHAGDYRTSTRRLWTLRPQGEAVLLAVDGPAKSSLSASAVCALWAGRRWLTLASVLAVLVIGSWVRSAHNWVRAAECADGPACASEGLCGVQSSGIGFACAATDDAQCAGAAVCRDQNRCAARDGACQPRDCSQKCSMFGLCVARGTVCIASSDADCASSWSCRQRGLCTARKGRCVLTVNREKDCSNHITCRSHGHCSSTPKGCLAATHADCKQSEDCRERGRCSADGFGLCRGLRDDDCKGSQVCSRFGFCTAIEGGCALSRDDTCGAFTECDYRAKCTKRGNKCVPTRDEHCALSLLCTVDRRCRLEAGECVR